MSDGSNLDLSPCVITKPTETVGLFRGLSPGEVSQLLLALEALKPIIFDISRVEGWSDDARLGNSREPTRDDVETLRTLMVEGRKFLENFEEFSKRKFSKTVPNELEVYLPDGPDHRSDKALDKFHSNLIVMSFFIEHGDVGLKEKNTSAYSREKGFAEKVLKATEQHVAEFSKTLEEVGGLLEIYNPEDF